MRVRRLIAELTFAVGLVLSGAALGNGDHNGDGTINLTDYAEFPGCLAGPSGGLGIGCDVFDFNGEEDVDIFDFAAFQRIFGTPARGWIDTVRVGNPGNAPDTEVMVQDGTTGYGAVAYVYNIGKYEVSAGQYTEFLNAVAGDDTYGLYNEAMWTSEYGCKIERLGSSPDYHYAAAAEWADRPVNFVSWGDAARFSNWLHNGRPTGPQNAATTEDGSYFLNGAMSDEDLTAATRQVNATWVIPSEDEWYKAAYHKNDGTTGNYWDYPTSSNGVPNNDLLTPDPGNNATFEDNGVTIGSPYYRTEVGAHGNSISPYGTFDQGGNVWEWNEISRYGLYRGIRGGSLANTFDHLHAAFRFMANSSYEDVPFGFRVAEVLASACGDGIVTVGEECDDGNNNNDDACPDDRKTGGQCRDAICGDGHVWHTDGGTEECDDGEDSTACDADCTWAECGDGYVNDSAGEECDDGNLEPQDGCDAVCHSETCADLTIHTFEAPDRASRDEEIGAELRVIITNIGDIDASQFFVGFYLSTDAVITNTDTPLLRGLVGYWALAAGGQIELPNNIAIPSDYPVGGAYLGILIDVFDEVLDECMENNNTAALPILIE